MKYEIKQLINDLGGAKAVSDACEISSQAVSQWKSVPANHVQTLSDLSGNEIKPWQIRPDIFKPQNTAA